MSQTFTDENLLTWEAYASSGNFGFATRPWVVFNCVSDPNTSPRYVERPGDEAEAEGQVLKYDQKQLRKMLAESQPLD